MEDYIKCNEFWNDIFNNEATNVLLQKESGNSDFDCGLEWLCENSNTILDFGCGSGTVLFHCSYYGSQKHIGIDLSPVAIQKAKLRSEKMTKGSFDFMCGSAEKLKEVSHNSVDAVILSNIVDNLYPADAHLVLKESKRVLRTGGKVLIKVNPYLTDNMIKENNIKIIEDNLLDDGLILWNNTTMQWQQIFSNYFSIAQYVDVYYKEYNQKNRMFLVENRA